MAGPTPFAGVDPERCAEWSQRVLALREHWHQRHWCAPFFTLGAAAYLDGPEPGLYEDRRKNGNPLLRKHFDDLLEVVRERLEQALSAPCAFAERFALPGFHIYLGSPVFADSGRIHWDNQFRHLDWSPWQEVDREHPLSFTIALRLPRCGGGLKSWQVPGSACAGRPAAEIRALLAAAPSTTQTYALGGGMLHDGLDIHQAVLMDEDADSEDARITLQGHGMRCDGTWILYW